MTLVQQAAPVDDNDLPQIYVVDDDIEVCSSVSAVLRANGFPSQCFGSAEEFLSQAKLRVVGCVITDLQMPGINGIELQAKLREMMSPLELIVVTGFADVHLAVQIMERGAVTLLEKPYDPKQLLAAVEKALNRSRTNFRRRLETQEARSKLDQLTEEEIEIMRLAIQGLTVKAISANLVMAVRTIDRRRQSAMQKLGIQSVSEFAVLLANAERS